LILVLLGLFSSIVDEVVATMTYWNKVSLASLYCVDVRSGVDEGPVSVWSIRSVGSLQILVAVVVVVFIEGSSQMAFFTAISTFSCGLFYCKVWHLQYSVLMVKDCKPVLLGGFLQPMFFQWVLDLVVSGEWILRSSKPCIARVFAGVPFLCRLFSVFFNLRQAMDDQRKKMTVLNFNVLLLIFLDVILC
jgi:hypothetical protein